MINSVRLHRSDERDVVDDFRGMRQQLAHPSATLAVPLKFEDRCRDGETVLSGGHSGDALTVTNRVGELLFVKLF